MFTVVNSMMDPARILSVIDNFDVFRELPEPCINKSRDEYEFVHQYLSHKDCLLIVFFHRYAGRPCLSNDI